ncbi:MAG TPA: hypothetical protein P5050_07825 [Bacteroidia bacterium]|nr:hypothetical protein [Bacteroidia bacterium]HRS59112.1 hypothetical protein [Bacteroidia bacterium]HRU69125.1 hypothetical protein [Bacteroidia bacterium]
MELDRNIKMWRYFYSYKPDFPIGNIIKVTIFCIVAAFIAFKIATYPKTEKWQQNYRNNRIEDSVSVMKSKLFRENATNKNWQFTEEMNKEIERKAVESVTLDELYNPVTRKKRMLIWSLIAIALIIAAIVNIVRCILNYNSELRIFRSRPQDNEVDDWIMQDIHSTIEKSFDRYNIDKDELLTTTFALTFPIGEDYRIGNDGQERYPSSGINLFFHTEDSIHYASIDFNHLECNINSEKTKQFFYKDIVSSNLNTYSDGQHEFKIKMSGDSFKVTWYYTYDIETDEYHSNAEREVIALNKIIQSKK